MNKKNPKGYIWESSTIGETFFKGETITQLTSQTHKIKHASGRRVSFLNQLLPKGKEDFASVEAETIEFNTPHVTRWPRGGMAG